MNLGPPLSPWLQLLGVLALEVALVVACAAAAARSVKWFLSSQSSQSSIWQRTIWQTCWLVLAVLTMAEITGLGRGAVDIARARFHPPAPVPPIAGPSLVSSAAPIVMHPTSRKAVVQLEDIQWSEDPGTTVPIPAKAKVQPVPEPDRHGWPAVIWLCLSGVFLVRWLMLRVSFAWFRWRYLKPASSSLSDEVVDLASRIGLRRIVRVLESIRLASPIAFGVFRPAVGLPGNFDRQQPPARRQVMLAHELAHLHSHDPEWYLLADMVLALLWWHPMVWWAQCQLHDASEAAADEASLVVADGPIALAECLVELGGKLIYHQAPGGLAMAGYGLRSNLAHRVRLLLNISDGRWQPPSHWRIVVARIFSTCALLAAILTGAAWVQPGPANYQTRATSVFAVAWQKSPMASLLNSAIGTENPFIFFARPLEVKPPASTPVQIPASSEDTFQPTPGGGDKVAIPGGPSASARPALQESSPPVVSAPTNSAPSGETQVSKGRQYILQKLDQIIIPTIEFRDIPLGDALEILHREVKAHDLDGRGLNFIINSHFAGLPSSKAPGTPIIDPDTGLPIVGKANISKGAIDIEKVRITISPPQRDLNLNHVLEAIVRAARQPIQFTVEDYAIVFSQGVAAGNTLDGQRPAQPSLLALEPESQPEKSKPEQKKSDTPMPNTNGPVSPRDLPQKTIEEEALRREEIAAILKINFSRAVESHKKGDLASAVKFYDEVLSLAGEIGDVGVERQKKETLAGLAAARIELAYRAQERGDFGAARAEADAILKFDPDNAQAIKFKEFNRQVTEANRTRLPSPETSARILAYRERQSRIDQMVRDAQALFDAGAYDDAKAKFSEAIGLDPSNDTASYYLRLIQEKHAGQSARQRELASGQRILEIGQAGTKQIPTGGSPSNPATNAPAPAPSVSPSAGTGATVPNESAIKVAAVSRSVIESNVAPATIGDRAASVQAARPTAPAIASPANSGGAELQNTLIRVDVPALYRELESAAGMNGGALSTTPREQLGSTIQSLWRNYFDKVGAQYGFHGMAPQLFLQTLAGVALVRGTPDETRLAERLAVEKFRVMAGAAPDSQSSHPASKSPVINDDNILTRFYRLDAEVVARSLENTFYSGAIIGKLPVPTDPGRPAAMNEMLRGLFAASGVEFDPGSPAAAHILFNALNGMLMVRATARDHEIIQYAVELLSTAPALVKIESREFDLSDEQVGSLKLGFSPGQGADAGPKSDAPKQMLALLTAEKSAAALHSLEQSGGKAVDFTPVVTVSGRPARVTYADGTFIDLTPTATAGNAGIDTSAGFEGRAAHFVVADGCTAVIGLQATPKSRVHFVTLTIIDSRGNPVNAAPKAVK